MKKNILIVLIILISLLFSSCTKQEVKEEICEDNGGEVFYDGTFINCFINDKFIKFGYARDLEDIKKEGKRLSEKNKKLKQLSIKYIIKIDNKEIITPIFNIEEKELGKVCLSYLDENTYKYKKVCSDIGYSVKIKKVINELKDDGDENLKEKDIEKLIGQIIYKRKKIDSNRIYIIDIDNKSIITSDWKNDGKNRNGELCLSYLDNNTNEYQKVCTYKGFNIKTK